jgi:hypothetical protein
MRKNRATRLAKRVNSIPELQRALKALREQSKTVLGREILPNRRKIETHLAAIELVRASRSPKVTSPDHDLL